MVREKKRYGFTLIELTVTVAILAIVATLAVVRLAPVADRARILAAEHDLTVLRDALTDPECSCVRDLRGLPNFSLANLRLANLLVSTNFYGADGLAAPADFARRDEEAGRGWRGPYFKGNLAEFPSADACRFPGDAPASARGFFPDLTRLRLPADFRTGRDGCSVYGFPGEPAPTDPWGNPYVLQIPPPQAFWTRNDSNTNLPEEVRFAYARVVSAGPDGVLSTPCFAANATNDLWATAWDEETCRRSRQAGRYGTDVARGDDLVLFLLRNDIDEGRRER